MGDSEEGNSMKHEDEEEDTDVKNEAMEDIVKNEVPSDDESSDEVKFTEEVLDLKFDEKLFTDGESSVKQEIKEEYDSDKDVKPKKGTRDHSKKDSSLKCERCKKLFCLVKSLRRHIRQNNCVIKGDDYVRPSKRPALCPHCGTTFIDRARLRKHIMGVHLKAKNHRCEECGKAFLFRKDLTRHMDTAHVDETHVCDFCPKTFTSVIYLREHVKRQHSSTTVDCPNCLKKFILQKNLDLHIANGICDDTRVEIQKKKKRMKAKEKTILCPYCPLVMAGSSNMKRHVELVHLKGTTGTSPHGKSHKCIHCEFLTPFEKKLQKHMDTMHPVIFNPYLEPSYTKIEPE